MNEKAELTDSEHMDEGWERKSENAPLIGLPKDFDQRTDADKIKWLHKIASSLDQACQMIIAERTEANKLLFLKENRIVNLTVTVQKLKINMHKMLTTANAEKQKLLEENKGLYAEIKELKNGN